MFSLSHGSALATPTKAEPWRVIAAWNPATSLKRREVDFGPRLHYGHLMEVYEQDGDTRIACFTKECQQLWIVCPHVAGWHERALGSTTRMSDTGGAHTTAAVTSRFFNQRRGLHFSYAHYKCTAHIIVCTSHSHCLYASIICDPNCIAPTCELRY